MGYEVQPLFDETLMADHVKSYDIIDKLEATEINEWNEWEDFLSS